MSIKWTPSLSVGVETIDEQHKIWFEKANGLFVGGKQQRAKEYIDSMLDFWMNTQNCILKMKKPIWKNSLPQVDESTCKFYQ